jgi:hypothetical protein
MSGHLDRGGNGADQLREARGGRAVSAEFDALQVREGIDFLLGIEALRRPRHGVEDLDALTIETLDDVWLGGLPELGFLGVAVGQERVRVESEKR